MYKTHSASPTKFGRRPSFGGKFRYGRAKKFNNSRSRFGGTRSRKRFGGDRIDFSRFVKKGIYVPGKLVSFVV